jgi:hypothetical protein
MASQQEKVYLITMKRKNSAGNDDCHWIYDKYIKNIVKNDDRLWMVKHEDKNECLFFIKKNINNNKNVPE